MDGLEVAVLLPAVIALVQVGLNMLTGAWPTRPTGVAYGAAIGLGIGCSFLYALATRLLIDLAIAAQLVILGITAAAGAAGVNTQSIRAEAKREQATGESGVEPPKL